MDTKTRVRGVNGLHVVDAGGGGDFKVGMRGGMGWKRIEKRWGVNVVELG